MRFWITKNSESPVREQLVRQVILGILSEDLPGGERLPSIRAFARRHNIHPNTVSAAYHDLLERGWLEMRRGSGVFVKPLTQAGAESGSELQSIITDMLRAARARGFEPQEVLDRLEQIVRPRHVERIVIAEGEPGLREIIAAEAAEYWGAPVESLAPADLGTLKGTQACLVAALASRTAVVRRHLPRGLPFLTLRMTSVRRSIEGQPKPPREAIIAVVSKSLEFRSSTQTILVAVGIDPNCVCEVDANSNTWSERLTAANMVITDLVCGRAMPPSITPRVFRILAPDSMAELGRFRAT